MICSRENRRQSPRRNVRTPKKEAFAEHLAVIQRSGHCPHALFRQHVYITIMHIIELYCDVICCSNGLFIDERFSTSRIVTFFHEKHTVRSHRSIFSKLTESRRLLLLKTQPSLLVSGWIGSRRWRSKTLMSVIN